MQIRIVCVMMTEWLNNINLPLSGQVWARLVITIKYSQIRIQLDTAPTIRNTNNQEDISKCLFITITRYYVIST